MRLMHIGVRTEKNVQILYSDAFKTFNGMKPGYSGSITRNTRSHVNSNKKKNSRQTRNRIQYIINKELK